MDDIKRHETDMNKPLDWRDRLHLACDPMTNDLGKMDADEATEALEYIAALEAAVATDLLKEGQGDVG